MIITLTPLLQAHLGVSLRTHCRRLRRDGLAPPPEVVDLADRLLSSGQGRPLLGCWCQGRDDEQRATGLLGVNAAASRLGISPRSLRRLAAGGRIARVRIGGRALYRVEDLDAFIETNLKRAG